MLELLWPSRCAGCGLEGCGVICPACRPGQGHLVPLLIAGVQGVYTTAGYDSGVGRAVQLAKYGARRKLALSLADDFAVALSGVLGSLPFSAVVPIPPNRVRLLSRGFNFPDLLASALAWRTGRHVLRALTLGSGRHQAGATRAQRLRGAGGRVRSVRQFDGEAFLIVDDVVTTGSTAALCARELLGAGSGPVWLATLCATRMKIVRNL